jgi:hypothetical protein
MCCPAAHPSLFMTGYAADLSQLCRFFFDQVYFFTRFYLTMFLTTFFCIGFKVGSHQCSPIRVRFASWYNAHLCGLGSKAQALQSIIDCRSLIASLAWV